MTDDTTTPPEGRAIGDVTIGPDGVTRRGTFQSPAAPAPEPADETAHAARGGDDVEMVPPPKSAGAHAGVTGAATPSTPPPVSSTSHANVAPGAVDPSPVPAGSAGSAAPVSTDDRTVGASDSGRTTPAPPVSEPVIGSADSDSVVPPPTTPSTSDSAASPSREESQPARRDERHSEAAVASGTAAAPAVEPAPPLAEAEKQAPAGTVPVAVAGATGEVPRTIYVEAPTPPKKKGNRGVGILISLLASLVFTIVWAGVSAAILAIAVPASEFAESYSGFIANPAWWVPVITFFIGLVIIVSILNRAGWAWYIIGGLLVGLLAYAGYVGGALISTAGQLSPAEVQGFLIRTGLNPLAIAVGITAREVSIWTGAAIAARGRRVKARNLEARAQFDRESAERRAEYERVRAGFAA